MAFLVGNAPNSQAANTADISAAKANVGKAVDSSAYRFDLSATSAITRSDGINGEGAVGAGAAIASRRGIDRTVHPKQFTAPAYFAENETPIPARTSSLFCPGSRASPCVCYLMRRFW